MDAHIPISNRPRVVIVGSGFGGIALARKLEKVPVQVVLIDKNNYHGFWPLLYQVATGGLEPDSIAYPIRKVFQDQENLIFRMAEVTGVRAADKELDTSIGPIRFDYLMLATGSASNFFGIRSFAENALELKTVPDALNMRSLLFQNFEKAILASSKEEREQLMNVVVVGGGPTGVEVSGALAEMRRHVLPNDYPELDFRQMHIHLIEAMPGLLNGMSADAQNAAKKYLQEMGVQLWLGNAVEKYEDGKVTFGQGKTIAADVVLWAAGVMGAAVKGLPAEAVARNKRINVNLFNQVQGYENIFAIGDVANMISEATPKGHPMVAQVAIQQGKLVAKNLVQLMAGKPMKEFAYNDKGSMATVGRNRAVADLPWAKFQGFIAWLLWIFVHLFTLVGFRNKVVTFVDWMWNYFSYDRALRLIIRPFNRPLKEPETEIIAASKTVVQ